MKSKIKVKQIGSNAKRISTNNLKKSITTTESTGALKTKKSTVNVSHFPNFKCESAIIPEPPESELNQVKENPESCSMSNAAIAEPLTKESHKNVRAYESYRNYDDKLDLNVPDIKTAVNTDNIKVVARFRPLNSVESDLQSRGMGGICVKYNKRDGCTITNSVGFAQSFTLDRIFDSNTTQVQLFEEVAMPTIQEILKGYNGTIFTYGQSGSGKTHTMYGSSLYDEVQKGVIPRSIEYIFDFINDPRNELIKFQIKFSMLEIYKECLYDLLNPENDSKVLKIKETKDKQIYVQNLTEEYITNIEDFLLLIDQADQYRVVSETGLNKQSSRSHLLFIIEILQQLPDGSEKCGKLNLIDLAGSEKIAKTGAQGETLEEAKKINLSLSTLGNVISSLSSEKDHIPYRDSKLTRILQDSLGGNSKTTLIVACSPHVFNSDESSSTLKFALRAKKIKNKVKQNIKKSTEELEKLIEELSKKLQIAKIEIDRLKRKLNDLPQAIKTEFKLDVYIQDGVKGKVNIDNNKLEMSGHNIVMALSPGEYGEDSPKSLSSLTLSQLPREFSNKYRLEDELKDSEVQEDSNNSFLRSDRINNETIKESNEGYSVKSETVSESKKNNNVNVSTLGDKAEDEHQSTEPKVKFKRSMKKFNRQHALSLNIQAKLKVDSSSKSNNSNNSNSDSDNDNDNENGSKPKRNNIRQNLRVGPLNNLQVMRQEKPLASNFHFKNLPSQDLIKKLQERDILLQKLSADKEKLVSSNIFLKEKYICLKEKLEDSKTEKAIAVNIELSRIEGILDKLQSTCKVFCEDYKNSNESSNNIEIKRLLTENQNLRELVSKTEKEYLDLFRSIKLLENENYIESKLRNQTLQNTIKEFFAKLDSEHPSYALYKDYMDINKNYFKNILTFFLNKQDFFNSRLYDSNIECIKDIEKCKSNNYKAAFIKFSLMTLFYEKILLSLIGKVNLDFTYREAEHKQFIELKSNYDKMLDVLNLYHSVISDFKMLKLNEILILSKGVSYQSEMALKVFDARRISVSSTLEMRRKIQNKESVKSVMNICQRPNNLIRKVVKNCSSSNLPKERYEKANLIENGQPQLNVIADLNKAVPSSTTNDKKDHISMLSNKGEGEQCETRLGGYGRQIKFNLNVVGIPASNRALETCSNFHESKQNDDQIVTETFRSEDKLSKSQISSSTDSKNQNRSESRSGLFYEESPKGKSNATSNEYHSGDLIKSRLKLTSGLAPDNLSPGIAYRNQMPSSSPINLVSPLDSKLRNSPLAQFKRRNAADRETSKALALKYVDATAKDMTDSNYLKELKGLKSEIEMYKTYIQNINSKLQNEKTAVDTYNELLKINEESSNSIYRTQIQKLQESFEVYRGFYEEELSYRSEVILKLSSTIDNILLK